MFQPKDTDWLNGYKNRKIWLIHRKNAINRGTTSHQSEWLRSKNLQTINAGVLLFFKIVLAILDAVNFQINVSIHLFFWN